jgi:hypothetical protein
MARNDDEGGGSGSGGNHPCNLSIGEALVLHENQLHENIPRRLEE